MVITRSKRIHANGRLTLAVDQSRTDQNSTYCCSSDDTFGVWTCTESGSLDVDIRNTADRCHSALAVFGEDVYLAQTSQDVITGVDQQVVVRYGLSSFLPSHALLTFSLEVTALATNGVYLIAGSSDFMVKSIRFDSIPGQSTIDRFECEAAILNISISPNGEYFAISTSDGNVHIRSIQKNPQTSASKKPVAKFKACNEFSIAKIQCPRIQCVWDPQCNYLFIPGRGGIIVVDCLTWDRKTLLTHPDIDFENFSVLSLHSSDESFLAASTTEGSIAIWKRISDSKFQLINIHKKIQSNIGIITSIVFHPQNSDVLLIAFSEGFICSMTGCNDVDTRFEQFCTSITGKPDSKTNTSRNMVEVEAMESGSPSSVVSENNREENHKEVSQFGYGQNDVPTSERKLFNTNDLANMLTQKEPCTTLKGMRVPKSISIGSTPISDDVGRFLAWNTFGIIKSLKDNDDESSIEINFHDSSVHHEIIIDNSSSKYVFGSISSDLIALASKKNANGESVLFVNHVTCWDHDARQWTQTMDDGEQIEGLCIGKSFIAIATNLRFLRVFTPSGTQRHFHTICAHESKLAVAYATGSVLVVTDDDYEHQIAVNVYEVNSLIGECAPILEFTVPLTMSPYSKLHWLQFSNCVNLVSMDDECNIRIYLKAKGVWIPVLLGMDLLKNPDDDYIWPIALCELPNAYFRYFYCRNSKFPPVNKSSLPTTTIPLKIPVINPSSEKGKLEAELMFIELQRFIHQQSDRPEQFAEAEQLTNNYIANLMKLFSVSCKMNRENRAVEIAHRSVNSKIVQGLCNYAAKIQRPTLSEKVATIGRERLQSIENEQNKQDEIRQLNQIKMLPPLLPSSSTVNEVRSPIIAPSKMLVPKRKTTSSSLFTRAAINSTIDSGKGKMQTIDENLEPTCENMDDDFAVFEANGKEKNIENASIHSEGEDEQGELNTSFASSALGSALLSDSFLLDSSPANNPFKRAKKTTSNSRGFTEKPKEGAIPDFFDSLFPPKRKH
uniref:Mcl1_mid domain-containing protein n=1 Tax=Meloidogyne hapla TaxID=6305 RepID=A0A1I8B4G2_MELHA